MQSLHRFLLADDAKIPQLSLELPLLLYLGHVQHVSWNCVHKFENKTGVELEIVLELLDHA